MEKPLVKLYSVMAAALVFCLLASPVVVRRTFGASSSLFTRTTLLTYQGSVPASEPEHLERDKPKVVFVMDDGWKTQYSSGYTVLKSYGFKGCISVIPTAVGTHGYVTYDQLAEMYMAGWDMLNHTYSHKNLGALTEKGQTQELVKAKDWLMSHLLVRGADVAVFPQGRFSDDTYAILKREGFVAARSLKSLWTEQANQTKENVEVMSLLSDTQLKIVIERIDEIIESKGTLILVLHKIEPITEHTQMQIEEQMLKDVAQYLYEKKEQIQVVTMTELINSTGQRQAA